MKEMAMCGESVKTTVCAAEAPETLFYLLGESYEVTRKALAMTAQISDNLFAKPLKERQEDSPRCTRDAVANHLDDLKVLCEVLNGIINGLGI